MNKLEEHMTDNHEEVAKDCYVESSMIAVENFWTCDKVFYSKEDFNKHAKLEIQCSSCKSCMAVGSSDFDYCAAMEHFGKRNFDETLESFTV